MATGDSIDLLARLKAVIPRRWFSYVAPIRDAIIGGLSDSAAWSYSWIVYARQQSRIATSTGPFLDLIAWDYFGARFLRRHGEADNSWRRRILQELLRSRATRPAIVQMLVDLTGKQPILFEGFNPLDTGGWGTAASPGMRRGYNLGGRWGSLKYRNQIFVTAYRPGSSGIPGISGWGSSFGGWRKVGAPLAGSRFAWSDRSQIAGAVTDDEIYQRVSDTVAAGTTAWVAILSQPDNSSSTVRLSHKSSRNSQYLALGL